MATKKKTAANVPAAPTTERSYQSATVPAAPITERSYQFFRLSEFDSPDLRGSGANMQHGTVEMLDKARALAGIPFVINSGFRTERHNRAVGGSENSAHLRGFAADIRCVNRANFEIVAMALIMAGFRRIGVHHSFIHADNDDSLPVTTWQYNRHNVEEEYRLNFVRAAIRMYEFINK